MFTRESQRIRTLRHFYFGNEFLFFLYIKGGATWAGMVSRQTPSPYRAGAASFWIARPAAPVLDPLFLVVRAGQRRHESNQIVDIALGQGERLDVLVDGWVL